MQKIAKQKIRDSIFSLRNQFAGDKRVKAETRIKDNFNSLISNLTKSDKNLGKSNIGIFMPIKNEVDTLKMTSNLSKNHPGVSLSLPMVTSTKKSKMKFKRFDTIDDLRVTQTGHKRNQFELDRNLQHLSPKKAQKFGISGHPHHPSMLLRPQFKQARFRGRLL